MADVGFKLDYWSGDASDSANPVTLTMTADKSVKANFARIVRPPGNLTAQKLMNRSLAMIEYVVKLTWQANPANANITLYRIYEINGGIPTLIAEVSADTLEYLVRNVQKDKEYTYGISAVNNQGWESILVYVTAK